MSRTYIGPFGGILPVSDSSHPQQSGRVQPPSQRSTPNMIAHQTPLLPLPTRLDFGSDPSPGFTDPNRYETTSRSRWGFPPHRYDTEGKLPSVRQMLSPGSQAGVTASSYAQRRSTASPIEPGSTHSSPHPRDYDASRFTSGDNSYFQVPHTLAPPMQLQYLGPSRDTPQLYPYPALQQSPYHSSTESNPNSPDDPKEPWRRSYPSPIGGSSQWHQGQGPDYRSVPRREIPSGQPMSEENSALKATRKLVAEKVIPGEGPCYVYEDGSHVKKFIDGEVVHSQWGVTKAGKPRKRLAIACMTCREKKIKCDPGEPKCVQCDKSGRECRFQTA